MQIKLELLAPAKNKEIGIAAIDCGADAVYIAGPAYGAREAAGNSFEDLQELVQYAHRFGVKIYLVLNTILYDQELAEVEEYLWKAYEIGCDAIIIQDLGILKMNRPPIPLHASTQTNIRTVEQAQFLSSFGFERIILARELSLDQIQAIRQAVPCEIETFVHGALCVSYSGACYLSQKLARRSANRGCCIQACRGRYDLEDADGRLLARNKTLLSLKDFSGEEHLEALAERGVCSFKIEGRLKNESYVKNIVRHYRRLLDEIIDRHPDRYARASWGRVSGGFTPQPDATFNRGRTPFHLDGKRKKWCSMEAGKNIGERIGPLQNLQRKKDWAIFRIDTDKSLNNGDGLCLISTQGTVTGLRIEQISDGWIKTKNLPELTNGCLLFRNYNHAFEKELEKQMPQRLIAVRVSVTEQPDGLCFQAQSEDGRQASQVLAGPFDPARNSEMALENIRRQIEKKSDNYQFFLQDLHIHSYPFIPAARLNEVRRLLALNFEQQPAHPATFAVPVPTIQPQQKLLFQKAWNQQSQGNLNIANHLSRSLYEALGAPDQQAYELLPTPNSELMRCKYCLRFEMGQCTRGNDKRPWYLINQGYRLVVEFDCEKCEMIIRG
ncbi:MAG: U32 family peptidase [Bacteroidales bacterium]|nr:U32 family peptidase [Bacteroidales bacterium]